MTSDAPAGDQDTGDLAADRAGDAAARPGTGAKPEVSPAGGKPAAGTEDDRNLAARTLTSDDESLRERIGKLGELESGAFVRGSLRLLTDPWDGPSAAALALGQLGGLALGTGSAIVLALVHPLMTAGGLGFDLMRYVPNMLWILGGLVAMGVTIHVVRNLVASREETPRHIEAFFLLGCFALPGAVAAVIALPLAIFLESDWLPHLVVIAGKLLGLLTLYRALEEIGGLEGRKAIFGMVAIGTVGAIFFAAASNILGVL